MVQCPPGTGEGHITGPYVDFLCTDEYTLTLAVPVTANGTIVGVAGADVLVETIELLLMDRLKDIDPRATLLNGSGRVIVSADPQLAAGALLVRGWQGSGTGRDPALPACRLPTRTLVSTRSPSAAAGRCRWPSRYPPELGCAATESLDTPVFSA